MWVADLMELEDENKAKFVSSWGQPYMTMYKLHGEEDSGSRIDRSRLALGMCSLREDSLGVSLCRDQFWVEQSLSIC